MSSVTTNAIAIAAAPAATLAATLAVGATKGFVTSALTLNVSKKGTETSYSFRNKKAYLAKAKADGIAPAIAKKRFQAELTAARSETTQRTALAMLAGKLTVSKVNLKDGEVSGIKFVGAAEADAAIAKVTTQQAVTTILGAEMSEKDADELMAALTKRRADAKAKAAAIEVPSTPAAISA